MGNNLLAILQGNVWLKKALLIMIVSLTPVMAMAQDEFAGGNGSEEEPYQIATWEHLDSVRVYLDAHFILMNDLDENTTGYTDYVKNMDGGENVVNEGQGWEPIGTPSEPFSGVFDGQGFTISGLHVDRIGVEEAPENELNPPLGIGLFGYVASESAFFGGQPEKIDDIGAAGAEIKNLNLENVFVRGALGAGAVAGINEGIISNVTVTGVVRGLFLTGGVAGANAGIISQATSEADVLFDFQKLIEVSELNVEVNFGFFGIGGKGGLVGYNTGGIILSNSSGDVGFNDEVIAEAQEFAEIGEEIVIEFNFFPFGYGGLVGVNSAEIFGGVTVSYSTSDVSGLLGTGGLIGMNGFDAFITKNNSSSFGLESSLEMEDFEDYLAGMGPVEIRDTYATGTVRGIEIIGGLIGLNGGEVYSSYSAGPVLFFEEAVTENDPAKQAEPDEEYYEDIGMGGLIGESFSNFNAKLNLNKENIRFSFKDVERTVQEFSDMFGIEIAPEYPVYNSFWDLQTSGVPISAGGTGLSTPAMKTIFTYLGAGWDFNNLWAIEEGYTTLPDILLKRNGNFISYPYFGNNEDAPLQTPAPGLSELIDDRVTVGSDTSTELDVDDFDFGSGETITILGLPSNGVLILEGPGGSSEVEPGDVINKASVDDGDLTYESTLPSRSISIYAEQLTQSIQYQNEDEDETITLFVDVAARSISHEEPEGWYFFASPSINETVGDLLNGIRTDGFPGSTNPGASFPTVYTIDQEAYEWEAVTSINQVLEQGQALLVYVFQDDIDALDDEYFELLLSEGPWLPLDGSFSFDDLGYDPNQTSGGNSFFLIANPHPVNVNICRSLSRADRVANNYYIWSPSQNDDNGGYINILCDLQIERQKQETLIFSRPLRPLEGFWVRTTDENPSLDIRKEDFGSDILFDGPIPAKEAEDVRLSPLSLNLEHNDKNYSGSAHVLFSSHGSDGLDNYDAMYLSSAGLAKRYLSVFAVDEENRKYNLQSLPMLTQEERVIPLGIETTEAGNYTFSWSVPSDTPAGVSYYLRDTKTESLTELEDGGRYSFSLSESEVTLAEKSFNGERNINAKETSTTIRFELIATMNDLNTGMELPTDITLKQNYPNPFNPTTVIEYQLPQSAQVRLQVYDMSGRQVAELVNEQVSAGTHTISFDASNLSSGVYMYRLQAGSTMLTRKLTVVK